MIITPWTIYWISRLDYLKDFFMGLAFVSVIATVVFVIVRLVDYDNIMGTKPLRGYTLPAILVCLILSMFGALIPTQKEMAAILVIPKIVNNEKVAAMPSKIVDLATEWLDHLKPSAK